jgi:predicted AAA+ superfamily ATPase
MARPAAGKATTVLEFDNDALAAREAAVALETDAEILERLGERFMVLDEMTRAVRSGDVRAMIVSGPPGVGKSYGVEAVLEKADLFTKLSDKKPKYEIVKGSMSSLGLYAKLYEFSAPGSVVVFDDCDGVLMDELSLNILKGALDSGEHRYISWNSDSRLLRNEGIPDRFDFRGAAIFITNINFGMVRSKKLREHLKALESRCHYIDLDMNTTREKLLRIQQVVNQAGMLDRYDFDDAAKTELMTYVEDNKMRLRELSLRMMLKIADLRKSFPRSWQAMARTTCMTK